MPVNVEIKARVRNLDTLRNKLLKLSDGSPQRVRQEDTFFKASVGRLKLRVVDGKRGELISYQRADDSGPTPSTYQISRVEEPETLRRVLSTALGVLGQVRKEREVFIIGRTRVHLDRVEDLGSYLELEVVLAPGEAVERGRAEARELMEVLDVRPSDLEVGAYVDVLETRAG